MISYNPLQQLHDLDRTSPQFHDQLSSFLRGGEYQNGFPNLQSEDLAWLVEYLDSVLVDISDPTSLAFQESLHELGKICGIKEFLPKSCVLSGSLLDISLPSSSGRACEGTLDGSRVRVKRVRSYPEGDPLKVKETFHRMAVVWKHLAHSNIVPLLGVTIDPLQLIWDWMSCGDLTEYIAKNPDADRLSLLSNVAEGLNYLHYCNVIHGDLKGSNILVDGTGRAQITDFGLATFTQNLDSTRNALSEHGDSARWIAPEIFDNRGTSSKEGDVFSFAMVTIEVFTGAVLFNNDPPHTVMPAIVDGQRPSRPTDPTFTDGLWVLTQRCWSQEPHLRPQSSEVLQTLHNFGPMWKRLISCPPDKHECILLITAIFSDKHEIGVVRSLRGDDAQAFVDVIDEMLDSLVPWLRRKCLSVLCRICGRQALLPRSVRIPLCYDRSGFPLYHGGYADVWKGEHQGRHVAVKVLTVYTESNFVKITSSFCKEVLAWKTLRHPNVLPLLGVTMGPRHFAMASEWMENGNINEFIEAHRDANRFELLEGVARGLIYMHGQAMVHGDLKGANILIDQSGHARLADFGLLTIVSDPTNLTASSSNTSAGTTRWMSPELLDPDQFGFENSRPTKESDCYALGMVILEVLSGQAPFTRYKEFVVMRKVIEGERPGRPEGAEGVWFTDDFWRMLENCWSSQPKDRPTVEAILERLERASTVWQPLPPSADCDAQTETETDTDESHSIGASHRLSPYNRRSDRSVPPTQPQGDQAPPVKLSTPFTSDLEREMGETANTTEQRIAIISRGSLDSEIAPQLLNETFNAPDYFRVLHGCSETEAQRYINGLYEIYCNLPSDSLDRQRCLRGLRKAGGRTGLLPTSYHISPQLEKLDEVPNATGGFSDVWKAKLANDPTGPIFALKVLRVGQEDDILELKKRFCKEVLVAKQVTHDNVHAIEGVQMIYGFKLCIVSEWMKHGNMHTYLRNNEVTDRAEVLLGVTRGLNYLHSMEVTHGDLKGSNILIDAMGNPRLTDFGFSSITMNDRSVNASTPNRRGSMRWRGPELLVSSTKVKGKVKSTRPTKKSDMYSLAMVVIEIFTGRQPFYLNSDEEVILLIWKGSRPDKPVHEQFTPKMWSLTKKCWNKDPNKRPEVSEVLRGLERDTAGGPSRFFDSGALFGGNSRRITNTR